MGLLIGIEIDTQYVSGHEFCKTLIKKGVLSNEAHETVIRLSPPLIIKKEHIDFAVQKISETLYEFEERRIKSA